MSSTALLKIPELRDLLCERLSQTDLVNCVRVSKSWHQGFTPQLWSKIKISSPLQDIAFSQPAARKAIRRHRRFIRSFSGPYPASLRTLGDELFADMTTTDSQLSDDGDEFTELRELRRDYIWSDSLVLRLVAFSPELQSLHLFGWCEEDSELVKLIRKLDHLKTMTILAGASSLLPLEDFRALLKDIPLSVETLSIDCSLKGNLSRNNNAAHSSPPPPSPSRTSSVLSKPLRPRAIKSLSLRGSALNTDPSVWSPFLSKCHNLQSFSVSGGMMNWNVHRIVEILQRYCPQLEELHLKEAGRCITDVYLAQFLSACDHPNEASSAEGDTNDTNFNPLIQSLSLHEQQQQQQQQQQTERRPRWKVFEVTALPAMGPLSNETLLAHTSTLEKVIVMDGNIMDSDTQYQILIQSPHLDTFKVLPDREGIFGIDPHQLFSPLPQDIVVAPWACESTLQTLWLAIRPTTLTSQQQRQVMRQLGRLHQLTELRLFNECVSNFNLTGRPGFTDLTLANGLDEWGGMKALRSVALLGFEHSFGDVEKEWVLEQWPVLESMAVGKVVVKLAT
ncbi:hypothetical protein BG015_011977 [Linnemannia schmuckeri]|uniref:F-box domain-containing protein n=1 Tax=Linnemannia schmuckeri TaxID=64567 RepID=A0A9P5S555_9FUNG|nr:hypothetical protein BG015_011977 [Linnemannia schmuckeri]